jgi:predicted dehydrogenase
MDALNIGVIGLGVMGQRMLERLRLHPRLAATMVWDANSDTLARTVELHPEMHAAHSAEALIASRDLHGLYIATPPSAHMRLSNAAFDAGLTVLCEKPLTVDLAAARDTLRRIADEKHRAAVNFSLASSPGLAYLQQTFGSTSALPLGALEQVQIDLAFAAWPRPWQMAAGPWLSERAEGGFAREVLSHFIFVLQRVLGPATVWASQVAYPAGSHGAETALQADLRVNDIMVQVSGRVHPDVPVADHNRMRWRAVGGCVTVHDWHGLTRQLQGGMEESLGKSDAMRAVGQADQLDQWVAMIEGRDHLLPGFAEALAVQETIEAVLAAG